MKIVFYLICLAVPFLSACHEVKEGFLNTTYAVYRPDSLVVKKTVDETNRPQFDDGADWVSAPLQGYDGTQPVFITIHGVKAEDGGDVALFLKETVLRGDGTFAIPVDNAIPLGRYRVSLELRNKDYSDVLDTIFTVVVKDR